MENDQPQEGGPYRTAPPPPIRYLCTVCYRSASTDAPGQCGCSGSPRLPIDNPEVIAMLRGHLTERAARRRSRAWIGLLALSAGLSAGICYLLGLKFFDEPGNVANHSSYFIGIGLALFVVLQLAGRRWLAAPRQDETAAQLLSRLRPVVTVS